MLINAELLLQFQRCQRRPYLDVRHDRNHRDIPSDLAIKLRNDKIARQKQVLAQWKYSRPKSHRQDPKMAIAETIELMQRGVDCIYDGTISIKYGQIPGDFPPVQVSLVAEKINSNSKSQPLKIQKNPPLDGEEAKDVATKLLAVTHPSSETADLFKDYTLLSNPDLLIKVPGSSRFGNWAYIPGSIELGKRPKQEYQIVAAYHAHILGTIQGSIPKTAVLMLRGKDTDYPVDLSKWIPQMQETLWECMQTLITKEAPEVFISRQKCSLCHWYSDCYATAQAQNHLSLMPGVTPVRYTHLQSLNITTPASLASANIEELSGLPGFDGDVAPRLILQAKSWQENRPLLLPEPIPKYATAASDFNLASLRPKLGRIPEIVASKSEYEIYFDIEAQPDLNLNYLLGVLVVNRKRKQEEFYSFLAENPQQEAVIWEDFLDLMWEYPKAPVYHFCVYEFDTVKRLAKQYKTHQSEVIPVLNRFIDIYEELTRNIALPIESYALKAIARWLGFNWRDADASGAKCIYWYDRWLKTGDRSLLEIIQRYNEDDCRATRSVKDWLVNFFQDLDV